MGVITYRNIFFSSVNRDFFWTSYRIRIKTVINQTTPGIWILGYVYYMALGNPVCFHQFPFLIGHFGKIPTWSVALLLWSLWQGRISQQAVYSRPILFTSWMLVNERGSGCDFKIPFRGLLTCFLSMKSYLLKILTSSNSAIGWWPNLPHRGVLRVLTQVTAKILTTDTIWHIQISSTANVFFVTIYLFCVS